MPDIQKGLKKALRNLNHADRLCRDNFDIIIAETSKVMAKKSGFIDELKATHRINLAEFETQYDSLAKSFQGDAQEESYKKAAAAMQNIHRSLKVLNFGSYNDLVDEVARLKGQLKP